MNTIVKSLAISAVVTFIGVQPGADAALSPVPSSDTGYRTAAVPKASGTDIDLSASGSAQDISPEGGVFGYPKPVALDMSAWNIQVPKVQSGLLGFDIFGDVRPLVDPEPQDAAKAEPDEPQVAIPQDTQSPQVAATDPAIAEPAPDADIVPGDRLVVPQINIPLPYARPQLRDLHPAAPRIERVKFEGPAGAPFAHARFCFTYPEECREHDVVYRGGPVELTEARQRELVRVNAEVNRSIIATQMNESVAQEKWLISPERGDCNDYAVTKRHKLIANGWPAHTVLLAEVVVPWGEHHLVVLVRTDKGDMVLDNLNANVLIWTKTRYEWVRVESPANPKFWSKIAAPATEVASVNRRQAGRLN